MRNEVLRKQVVKEFGAGSDSIRLTGRKLPHDFVRHSQDHSSKERRADLGVPPV